MRPGDERRLPPRGFVSRLGFIIVTGATMDQCSERLEQARSLMEAELEPI